MAAQLHLVDDDLGDTDEPEFLQQLDLEILWGLEVLLERHARFQQYLAEHGRP